MFYIIMQVIFFYLWEIFLYISKHLQLVQSSRSIMWNFTANCFVCCCWFCLFIFLLILNFFSFIYFCIFLPLRNNLLPHVSFKLWRDLISKHETQTASRKVCRILWRRKLKVSLNVNLKFFDILYNLVPSQL